MQDFMVRENIDIFKAIYSIIFDLFRIKSKSISTWTTSIYTHSKGSDSGGSTTLTSADFLKDLACLDVLPSSIINLLNSLLIALVTSLTVITLARERTSGSKSQQLLTGGTHSVTYWLSNYAFDLAIILFEFGAVIATLKIVDLFRNDGTSETSPLASATNLPFLILLFVFVAFSSCALAYVWSFFFRSEMIAFVVLAILLGVTAFLDMIASFVQIFVQVDTIEKSWSIFHLMTAFRYVFMILCPNVTVKRGLYFLKIRQSKYCINAVNRILNGIFQIYYLNKTIQLCICFLS